jgi:hypothetical protein
VLELGQCVWIGNHLNILVLGPTGGEKSFLACALGTAAIRQGSSVRDFRTSRLQHALGKARQEASYPTFLRSLARTDLLILDDWMRDELTPANAQDILEFLDDRYSQAASMVASHMPVTDWFTQIPNSTLADAILDRLVHNAYRFQLVGESQRKLRAIRSMSNTLCTIIPPALIPRECASCPNALFLSVAAVFNHPFLTKIYNWFSEQIVKLTALGVQEGMALEAARPEPDRH